MTKNFDVIFDNGGNTILQVDKRVYVHCYDTGDQAAIDVRALLDGDDTSTWDGNEPENREEYNFDTERNGGYKWYTSREIADILKSGEAELSFGHNEQDFFRALGIDQS